jgi:hypothetical protein
MKTKSKILIYVVAIIIVLIISGGAGFMIAKKIYYVKPEPPQPGKTTIVTVVEGEEGTITFVDEKFYSDMYTSTVISTGIGVVKQTVIRPDIWKYSPKSHFIGFGAMVDVANGRFMYGGFIQYRYRVIKDISIMVQYFLAMNDAIQYDTGLKAGVEIGIK